MYTNGAPPTVTFDNILATTPTEGYQPPGNSAKLVSISTASQGHEFCEARDLCAA